MSQIITPDEEWALIQANMGLLMRHVAQISKTRLSSREDYLQAGYIGLLKAVRKYNPEKGSFSTFAWPCIRHELIKEAYRNDKSVDTLSSIISMDDSKSEYNQGLAEVDFMDGLTDEEQKIVNLLTSGYSNEDICELMEISLKYLRSVIKAIFNKVNDES